MKFQLNKNNFGYFNPKMSNNYCLISSKHGNKIKLIHLLSIDQNLLLSPSSSIIRFLWSNFTLINGNSKNKSIKKSCHRRFFLFFKSRHHHSTIMCRIIWRIAWMLLPTYPTYLISQLTINKMCFIWTTQIFPSYSRSIEQLWEEENSSFKFNYNLK